MRKREKSGKHRIITIIIALAVILALLLSAVSCSGCGREMSTDTTNGTTVYPNADTTGVTESTVSQNTEPGTQLGTAPEIDPATESMTEPTSVSTEPEPTETQPEAADNTETQPTESKPAECKHNYVSQITESPTCTASGIRTFVCDSCGSSYTESIAPYGHEYKTEVIAPTQTSQGYTLHTCSRCGESYKDSYTDPVPAETAPTGCQHEWQEVHHEAETHDIWWIVCACGERFTTDTEWLAHVKSFSGAEVVNHLSYGETRETIIDIPSYSTWVCSKCGEVSETEP